MINLWKLGEVNSLTYKTYDFLRNGLNKRLAEYLYGFIAEKNANSIIEAGSGPGFCASILNKRPNVASARILDIDSEVLRLAKLRDESLDTVLGNLLGMPFADCSFDLVYNSSTLEHLKNYKEAFSEMVRVCRPGGYIFVGLPFKYGPLSVFSIFPKKSKINQWVGQFIPSKEVTNWVNDFPIKLIDEKYYFYRFFKGFMFKKTS